MSKYFTELDAKKPLKGKPQTPDELYGVLNYGTRGPIGPSGVYVGAQEPTDPEYKVWINPDGDPSSSVATQGWVLEQNYQNEDEVVQLIEEYGGSGEWEDITNKPFNAVDTTTLKVQNGVLSVNTIETAITDNTQPITSGGVFTIVGNINILLEAI